jgi:hypothetical protein
MPTVPDTEILTAISHISQLLSGSVNNNIAFTVNEQMALQALADLVFKWNTDNRGGAVPPSE